MCGCMLAGAAQQEDIHVHMIEEAAKPKAAEEGRASKDPRHAQGGAGKLSGMGNHKPTWMSAVLCSHISSAPAASTATPGRPAHPLAD